MNIFGPTNQLFISGGKGEEKVWSTVLGISDVSAGLPINGALNTTVHQFAAMRDASWDGCQLVPSAFSVQIMNPTPVSSAAGVARIGRLRYVPDLQNDTRTWDELAEQITSYNFPRLCAGGKLALRGVKVDAVPFDMTNLSDFTMRIVPPTAGSHNVTWDTNYHLAFQGFAPIVVLMDQAMSTAGELDILVTCEWRVRFDPGNPAQGTHTHHPVASDSTWGKCLAEMEALGSGTLDIAERVAELGAAVKAAELMPLMA